MNSRCSNNQGYILSYTHIVIYSAHVLYIHCTHCVRTTYAHSAHVHCTPYTHTAHIDCTRPGVAKIDILVAILMILVAIFRFLVAILGVQSGLRSQFVQSKTCAVDVCGRRVRSVRAVRNPCVRWVHALREMYVRMFWLMLAY